MSELDAVTPYRAPTLIEFDVPDPQLLQDPFHMTRNGGEISKFAASGVANPANNVNMRHWWTSGAWTLAPLQGANVTFVHEKTDPLSLIIPATKFNLVTTIVGRKAWSKAQGLTGVTYDASVAATGDEQLHPAVGAGVSWNQKINSAIPPLPLNSGDNANTNVPMLRSGESTDVYGANQGFFLRWTLTGTSRAYPDFTWTFYFGQYGIAFQGDGQAQLWEYCRDVNAAYHWRHRSNFRYARPPFSEKTHTLLIWPVLGPQGEKYIHFEGTALDVSSGKSTTENLYTANPDLNTGDIDMAPGAVTMAGHIAFDKRAELKVIVGISKLGWQQAGVLIDTPFSVPMWQGAAPAMNIRAVVNVSPTYTIVPVLLDAADGVTPYVSDPGKTPFVKFTFAGDGNNTGALWGYLIDRDAIINENVANPFTMKPRNFTYNGAGSDPSTESGTALVTDMSNATAMPNNRLRATKGESLIKTTTGPSYRLRARGEFPVLITTGYQDRLTGAVGRVPIARGYAQRSHSMSRPGGSGYDCHVRLVGAWARLKERVHFGRIRNYAVDKAAPGDPLKNNAKPPWTVTAAIRDLINFCGYPLYMIDIIELPNRLWMGVPGKEMPRMVRPQTNYADLVVTLAKNFLGAYLTFAEEAGTRGQWKLIFPPKKNAPALAGFQFFGALETSEKPGGFPKLQHVPGSYSASPLAVYPVLSATDEHTIRPEYNIVHVWTGQNILGGEPTRVFPFLDIPIDNWAYNPYSFDVPGMEKLGTPDHPDWIGRGVMCQVCDLSLTGPTGKETQAAVDWTVRRIYDFVCHGQRLVALQAPLAFVVDPQNGMYRKLRFQDPVMYNDGSGYKRYLMHSAPRINYHNDRIQMAEYELIRPIVTPADPIWVR